MNRRNTHDTPTPHHFHAGESTKTTRSIDGSEACKRQKWRSQKDAAKNIWGRLSDEELDNVDGRFHSLIGLIRARYRVSYDEAYDQVKLFFDNEASTEQNIECIDVFWPRKVNAAHLFWPGLSEPDLVLTKGEPKKLIELLQQNYIIAFNEAVRQVDTFLVQQSVVGMR